jgi:hypothetical protein
MTLQEAYDMLYESAYDGSFPSIDEEGTCLYRADKTAGCKKRCGAGKFLQDEKYDADLECTMADMLPKNLFSLPEGMFLRDLLIVQNAHDDSVKWNRKDGKERGWNWDPDKYICNLNLVPCFTGVNQREPKESK